MVKEISYGKNGFLGVFMMPLFMMGLLPVSITGGCLDGRGSTDQVKAKQELSSLSNATGWINSKPLSANELKGKVVLLQFCTYTCINWLRTMPYVRAWAEKYKRNGLVVVAIHTPEFSFEKNIDNVQRAMKEMKIDIPVAIDNEQEIWNAFGNEYWPALYFIDTQGRIRHHQFGEGKYDVSEKIIQQLLIEAGEKDIDENLVSVDAQGIEVAADWDNLNSQENYLGYERTENFASPGGIVAATCHVYSIPSNAWLNQWGLMGNWTIDKRSIKLNKANGKIMYRFHARDLHIVMGPASAGKPVRFRVLIDGKTPGASHGIDIDEQGNGTVGEQRLYQLIRQQGAITDREITIEFIDAGVEAFSFTFG